MSTKTGRRQKRQERSRRHAVTASNPVTMATKPVKQARAGRNGRVVRSSRWMLSAAIVTTVGACADAALLAVSSGGDRILYGGGLVLWIGLGAYHWNRWLSMRRKA